MSFKSKALFFTIVLHLSVFIVISAGDTEISKNPSIGKINPVHHRHFDERKISKRHNEPDFQTCLDNFEIHQDKIIRTQDSRAMGARYINERDVPSRDDCLRLCCETADCDVFVFEERSPGSCYLFQCGTSEEFKCKFTKHRNYTSGVLALNRHMTELESQIKLTKHEHELTNLRQTDSSPTAIIPVSKTESTSLPENKETEQLVPSSSNNNSANDNSVIIRFNRRCSRYQFECRSSEECIAIYNACDGIPQCSDGSDEAPELGCPALMTTITPAERVSQGEIPENMGLRKGISDSSLHSMPSQSKHQHVHQSAPIEMEQQSRRGSKEYNSDPWMQQPPGYRSNEQSQTQQHHRHQELQLEQQNQQLQQQQLQEHEQQQQQQQQQQQRLRQQELQHQQQLLQENRQQKLQRIQPQQDENQQIQQTQIQQHVSSNGNYIQNNNGIQPQQLLTMSSVLPQQHPQIQQTQTQQTLQQSQQLDSIQSPQQLVNQAKLYGREGEGLLYHSPSSVDSLHWPSNSNNNYQQEQTQENLPYHLPNSGMSQIFNHKGNSLVSQSERAGNQFADTLPNEYNHNNYFDNTQYRMPPHAQQNSWQSVHKPIHEMNTMDESLGGPHEGESAVLSGLNSMIPDYYYEESMRNKLQQQLLAQQQRLLPQNNAPITNGEQLLQGQYKDLKSPVHEEITLDQSHHDSSTGESTSVKKASPQHPSSVVITTEKPKETKAHHHGHNSHRKMEQLTAEVTLRETNFDGITMEQAGSPSGAILSLTLGMCVTAVMIVLVGCRMRTVRRRMRRGGKSAYAHDADFLVNGMYL